MHDRETLHHHGVRWDNLPVMEDFDVTLQLLRLGYENMVLFEWAWGQPSSNAPGGCSAYRTYEVQKAGAEGLAALHPDYVTPVQKPSKNWRGFDHRWDVKVRWKAALAEGAARRQRGGW